MIPKKIYQTWKTKNISKKFQKLINTWKDYNKEYDYSFSDDKDCENFLKNFDKKIFKIYEKIVPGAFKADLWRVCVLYEFGGFYCDVDTLCMGQINNFIDDDIEFIVPIDLNINCFDGYNLFNSFIGVAPHSPIMKNCIEKIVYNVQNNIVDIPALDFSACGVLGRATNTFLKLPETESFIGKEGIYNNIHFLKFDPIYEYVQDVNGNILFQNKNKNYEIYELFQEESKNVGVVSWANTNVWIKNKDIKLI